VAKIYKPDFIYIKSDLLKMEVAVSKKSGWVYCEDGIKYSPQEAAIVQSAGSVLDMATHNVKKYIGGEIVGIERTTNKTGESRQCASTVDNASASQKIQSVNGNSAENGQGELEIY